MATSLVVIRQRLCPYLACTLKAQSRKNCALFCHCYKRVLPTASARGFHLSKLRCSDASGHEEKKIAPESSEKKPASESSEKKPASESSEKKPAPVGPSFTSPEKHIPISRYTLIRMICEDKDFLTDAEKKLLPSFTNALDTAIINRYHSVLQDLKQLFDPINPDKEILSHRELTRSQKLESEFWLLQRLESVMEKANFRELDPDIVKRFLDEHQTPEGVKVKVDIDNYDVLRFWTLGFERPKVVESVWEKFLNKLLNRPPRQPAEYYKRVVLAVRLKGSTRLMLKGFKEVPSNKLETLLPDGRITISPLDRSILATSASVAAFGVLAKTVTVLANIHVDWMLLLTAVSGTIGYRAWSLYVNKRNEYLVSNLRTLYFKNLANNRSLITLLVDRAEDESLKEALLTYMFLLRSRPSSTRSFDVVHGTVSLGGLTEAEMKSQIEAWIHKQCGVTLNFSTVEALSLLQSLGLVESSGGKYQAALLHAAARLLPASPPALSQRTVEPELSEGYDRDEYLETEDEYKHQDTLAKRYGWFSK